MKSKITSVALLLGVITLFSPTIQVWADDLKANSFQASVPVMDENSFKASADYSELNTLIQQNQLAFRNSQDIQVVTQLLSDGGNIASTQTIKKYQNTSEISIPWLFPEVPNVITSSGKYYLSLDVACAQLYPQDWNSPTAGACFSESYTKEISNWFKNNQAKYVKYNQLPDEKWMRYMGRDRSLTSEVSNLDVSNKADYEYQILNLTTDTTFQKSKPDDCSIFDTREVCIPTFSSWNEYTQIEKISDDTQVEGTLYSFQINPRRTCDYCGSVKMTYHFTQQGLLTYSTMDYVSQFLSYTYKTIFTLNTGIPVTALSSEDFITKEQFALANNQLIAKSKLSNQATSITNKAKLFAKRAKQALSSTHLIQAAKGLKIKYVSSGKGIKITQKYLNATLSSCLSVVNKNVQVKPCS